jgi:DNA (cytosine-5)-methyltransferase 1
MDLAKLQGHKVSREADNLFGTPRGNAANSSASQVSLGAPKGRIEDQVKLLPTPNTMEHREIKTSEQIIELQARSPGGYRNLRESVINEIKPPPKWGKFEPAIRRWETILGRPAPEPTKPDGKDNNHRLSSKFTEWMMGLPDGWITGHDLKRNDELKLAGNGVVPQQAELALRLLLELPEGER